ncbi:MAG: peptidase inhibitor family I36 protein [Dermatophilaceae bacterium]
MVRKVVVCVGMAVVLVASAAPAHADVSQCGSGEACVWKDFNYDGSFRGMTNDGNDYSNISWRTAIGLLGKITRTSVSSVRNEGQNCYVRFWSGPNGTGDNLDFWRVLDNANYQDPDLRNGGGLDSAPDYRKNFNDRVASHRFFNC